LEIGQSFQGIVAVTIKKQITRIVRIF